MGLLILPTALHYHNGDYGYHHITIKQYVCEANRSFAHVLFVYLDSGEASSFFFLDVKRLSSQIIKMITPVTINMLTRPSPAFSKTSPIGILVVASKVLSKTEDVLSIISSLSSAKKAENQSAGDDGRNLTGNVDADGMHQQEVLIVLGKAHFMNNARRHRESGNSRGTDHRIDFLL